MMDENTCILVVDDHPIVSHGVSVLLTAAMPAVKTEQAHNGAEALKKAQTHTFQVFVLDVELPDMSGVKLMEALRENNWLVRKALGTRVRNQLRHVPELAFYVDDSLEYIEAIDKLLK